MDGEGGGEVKIEVNLPHLRRVGAPDCPQLGPRQLLRDGHGCGDDPKALGAGVVYMLEQNAAGVRGVVRLAVLEGFEQPVCSLLVARVVSGGALTPVAEGLGSHRPPGATVVQLWVRGAEVGWQGDT